jgi:palmitoyltransferase
MSMLSYYLFIRCQVIWTNRALPAYLGPPAWALIHLVLLVAVNSITLFALGILLVRAVYSMAGNTTMIEEWEIEKHEALVERARKTGGFVYGNGGQRLRVQHQEFPYDIGVWQNICQAMGTKNVLLWFMPFSGNPSVTTALEWEENGFEDAGKPWPPPDPDKMPRVTKAMPKDLNQDEKLSDASRVEAFRRRQQADLQRQKQKSENSSSDDVFTSESEPEDVDAKHSWKNSEGEMLGDYGVDEDTEILEEEEVPLGELLRRREARVYS